MMLPQRQAAGMCACISLARCENTMNVLRTITVVLALAFVSCVAAKAGERANINLNLPDALYAVVGEETNIFFESVVTTPPGSSYSCKIISSKGRQQVERWAFTPTSQDVGDFPLTIEVRDSSDSVVARASTVVSVAPSESGEGILLLAIGDSLTEAGVYTEELLELGKRSGGAGIKLLGSHHSSGSPENLHEGYGGWKYDYFLSRFDASVEGVSGRQGNSPFIFKVDGAVVLDISRYVREKLAGASPGYVTVFLGTNDVFGADDKNREKTVDAVVAQANQLIDAIRKAMPEAKVGVLAPLAPADQNAFGENYGCEFDRWTYRKNQTLLVQKLISNFSNREGERIYFVPAFVNFDPAGDYPTSVTPKNARNREMVTRQTNAVHPAETGYQHVADSIYAWLVNVR